MIEQDFKFKMSIALADVQNACLENEDREKCKECPFYVLCQVLQKRGYGVPEEWGL